jgi:Zn-dependent protease
MFMRWTWRVGRIAGIEIAIHPSWLVIYALFAWSATVIAPTLIAPVQLGRAGLIELGLVYSLLLFASVVAHELSHALVARRLGIPIGNITLFLFGGVATIKREPGSPADEFKVAIAGPAMSVLLSIIFAAIAWPLPARMEWTNALFWLLAVSNVALALFNLLPAFPSDGGRILRALLWRLGGSQAKATAAAGYVSLAVAVLLVCLGVYLIVERNSLAIGVLAVVRGEWVIIIALFLAQAALTSIRASRSNLILEMMPVSDCMAKTIIPVPAATSIANFVAELAVNGRGAGYPVVTAGAPIGLVTLADTSAVPHMLWHDTPVTAVMTPSSRTPAIAPTLPAWQALAALDDHHVDELPVFEDNALIGIVSRESIYAALREKERPAGR